MQISITCNAILQKTQDGITTYSFYYGQHYNKEVDTVNADNLLSNVYSVTSLEDLEALPLRLSYDDVHAQFSRTFDEGSAVVVHELTHYVIIFRCFLEQVGSNTYKKVPLLLEW